jgi:hypothetical protein
LLTVGAVAGLTGIGVLAGCSHPSGPTAPGAGQASRKASADVDPVSSEPSRPAGSDPQLPTFPGAVEGAAIEDGLAAHASTVLSVGKDELGKAGRALVTAVRDQHRAHAAALRSTDPTDPNAQAPPATPAPTHSGKKPSFAKAVDQLVAAEKEAGITHRATALRTKGLAALLWGSMSTSAVALAGMLEAADLAGDDPRPGSARVAAVKPRAPMPVLTIVQAEQQLVAQLHAIIYGYQLALGRLTGTKRDTAAAELKRHRMLRDRLTARLLNRKAEVPVAKPAYVPTTNPRNARTAGKLIRQMETALVPFCGLWLVATDVTAERAEALDQVGRTSRVSRQWGASLPAWPGWKLA